MTIFAAHCAADSHDPAKLWSRRGCAGSVSSGLRSSSVRCGCSRGGCGGRLRCGSSPRRSPAAATAHGLLDPGAAFWLYVLAALYLGFEGRALRRRRLTRRGRPLADIVCAADSARRRARVFRPRRRLADAPRPPAPPRGGPAAGAPHAVIGLFPEAGG